MNGKEEIHGLPDGPASPKGGSSLADEFIHCRKRLRQSVQLRMDRRLCGRVDPSDVLQEAYLDIMSRAEEYANNQSVPIFLWFRLVALQRLQVIHRRHLGTKMRDARLEIAMDGSGMPGVTAQLLAGEILSGITSPSSIVAREEREAQVQAALEQLAPADREVLAMRQFEDLTNDEVALILGIKKSAASARHVRALERLRQLLVAIPGFFD
jgi:RNA polymerase sigma-70 factor (ECF subfamily)